MSPRAGARPHGQLRESQLITTFGPGALLDLPRHSVIVGGLDEWSPGGAEIYEPRLAAYLQSHLERDSLRLVAPPVDRADPHLPPTGITTWQFPEWFVTQDVLAGAGKTRRARALIQRTGLEKGKYLDADRKLRPVVPVRFVRACRRGHISDIDWYGLVHGQGDNCRRQLWMVETGTSGDLSEVVIRCDCGQDRLMSDVAAKGSQLLGRCNGSRPWLGAYASEACGEPSRLLVRTASNSYFPQVISVISLPDADDPVVAAVGSVWDAYLRFVDSVDDLTQVRAAMPPVKAALLGIPDDQVMRVIVARKEGKPQLDLKPVKVAELEVLASSSEEIGNDQPDGEFYARALPPKIWKDPVTELVDRVVLVHRLREVAALAGFTRFEAATPDVQGELELGVESAPLAREADWLPAVENRGEGIFVALKPQAIANWLTGPGTTERGGQLLGGFKRWKQEHPNSHGEFVGVPYVMLHSLSHLLLTTIALECGYPASSIRERIYAGEMGYGILLYTATSDAEGTLGGLVEAGRSITEHLKAALERGSLCSNDPVCSEHSPEDEQERRFLLGAACHGCLLIAETSCERHNSSLDRALVVPTISTPDAAFFKTSATG